MRTSSRCLDRRTGPQQARPTAYLPPMARKHPSTERKYRHRPGDAAFPGFAAFRDEADAPFFSSRVPKFGTAEATGAEITRCLSQLIFNVTQEATRRPLRLELDDLLRWHQAIFRSTFPYQAGVIRSDATEFQIRWRDEELRTKLLKGAEPRQIRKELAAAIHTYNAEHEGRPPEQRPLREAVTAAATLYADLLRIHPFDDGNLRAAFPALQGALVSLGAAPVDFEGAVAQHDEALGWALLPSTKARTIGPFVDLLIARIPDVVDKDHPA
jgi:fido (protein-threonine AMPylation protein)